MEDKMAEIKFRITGRVINLEGQGISGLRIEAWDKDLIFNDFVGNAITDESGHFQISFYESYFKELFFDRRPDLYFKIYRNEMLIYTTENSVIWNADSSDHELEIKIDDADVPHLFSVSGKVINPDGSAYKPKGRSVAVIAYDKGVGELKQVGPTVSTSDTGYYEIRYESNQLDYDGKERADLIVKVYLEGSEVAILSSPFIMNAKVEEKINLVIGLETFSGPTEYEVVSSKLDIELQNVTLEELRKEDIAMLSNKTGLAPWIITYFIKALKLSLRTDIAPKVYYALFRQNMPTQLHKLLAQEPKVLQAALQSAVMQHIARLEEPLDDIIEKLQEAWVQQSVNSAGDAKPSLLRLMQTASLSDEHHIIFLSAYTKNNHSLVKTWNELKENGAIGEQQLDDLRLTLLLGALTMGHVALVEALLTRDDIHQVQDLIKITDENWAELLSDEAIGVPEGVAGESQEEQIEIYLRNIKSILEHSFPTRHISRRLTAEADELTNKANLQRFFSDNPYFEFRSSKLGEYLSDHPEALAGIPELEREETVRDLEAWQRLFCVSPEYDKYEVIKTLWANDIASAHKICSMGKYAFIRQYADQIGGKARALTTFSRAHNKANMSLMTLARYGRPFNSINTYVTRDPLDLLTEEDTVDMPDLETLFGTMDFCDCQHCRSLLSPAAYLVDLLLFLDKARNDDGQTALEKLLARRPDLAHVQLNCENTNTTLPYVDLVNEVLENAIAPYGHVPQTTLDTQTLKAAPEHLNIAAYDVIKNEAKYPWNLPFDLWTEEARLFLNHLGVPRHQLMETFRSSGAPLQLDIMTEYLSMTTLERQIITGEDNDDLNVYWGLSSENELASLTAVPNLLAQSHLTVDEISAILQSRLVNPTHKSIDFGDEQCALESATLDLTPDELDKFHRFHRLQQKLGWSVTDLDKSVKALAEDDINDEVINCIGHIKKLQEKIRLPLVEMLCWWSLLDIEAYEGEAPFYYQLFLNKTVNPSNQTHFEIEGNDLITPHQPLLEAVDKLNAVLAPTILGATNLKAEDLLLLIAVELPDEKKMNLASLSHLFRIASFTKALNLSIQDYLSLMHLTGKRPMTHFRSGSNEIIRANPTDTTEFVAMAEMIKGSGFSIPELDFLLRHKYPTNSPLPPDPLSIAVYLEELRAELKKTKSDIDLDKVLLRDEDLGTLLREQLDLNDTLRDETFEIIEATTGKTEVEQREFLQQHFGSFLNIDDAFEKLIAAETKLPDVNERYQYFLNHLIAFLLFRDELKLDEGNLTEAFAIIGNISENSIEQQKNFVKVHFAAFMDPQNAIENLIVPGELIEYSERYRYVLEHLAAYLLQKNLVIQKLSSVLPLDAAIAERLLTHYISYPTDQNFPKAIQVFLGESFVDSPSDQPIDKASFPALFHIYDLLHKISLFVQIQRIHVHDLEFILNPERGPGIGWLDLTRLPVETVDDENYSPSTFEAWKKLMGAFELQDNVFSPSYSVFQFIDELWELNMEQINHGILPSLSERTGWPLQDIKDLLSDQIFAIQDPLDFQNEKWIKKLADAFDIIFRTGANALQVNQWKFEMTADRAASIKNACKAKYDLEQWLKIAPPIRDFLREKQRNSLQSYVIVQKEFEDAAELYSHYLIDTEMSACMVTSRIKQAISSVQLFVQRVMMNLEAGNVTFEPEIALEWQWRKNYRVWEANRKVFLYPENWIEPDLRTDKTPFFRELEEELLQDDISDTTAQQALSNYLEKLEKVSRLEIAGFYDDEAQGAIHVFARTMGTSHRYFYRKWIKEKTYWTPWEEVDLDIEGEYLIPVVFNNTIYLFWPVINKKEYDPYENNKTFVVIGRKYARYEIKLAWSCYANKKWAKKRMSSDHIVADYNFDPLIEEERTRIENLSQMMGGTRVGISLIEFLEQDKFFFQAIPANGNLELYLRAAVMIPKNNYRSTLKGSFVSFSSFQLDPCSGQLTVNGDFDHVVGLAEGITIPANCTPENMKFVETDGDNNLELDTKKGNSQEKQETILYSTPGTFMIAYPHQDEQFYSQRPFFYEDDKRTFFVVPSDVYEYESGNGTGIENGGLSIGHAYEWVDMWQESGDWHPPYEDIFYHDNPFDFLNPADVIEGDYYWEGTFGDCGDFCEGGFKASEEVVPGISQDYFNINDMGKIIYRDTVSAGAIPESAASTDHGNVTPRISLFRNAMSQLIDVAGTELSTGTRYEEAASLYDDVTVVLGDEFEYDYSLDIRKIWAGKTYDFHVFFHPYTCLFRKQLNRYGVEGLLAPDPGGDEEAQSLVRQKIEEEYFPECYLTNRIVTLKRFKIIDFHSSFKEILQLDIRVDGTLVHPSITVEYVSDGDIIDLNNLRFNFSNEVRIEVHGGEFPEGFYDILWYLGSITINRTRGVNIVSGISEAGKACEVEYTTEVGKVDLNVNEPHPLDDIDFEHQGAYSQYNWEIFFHIPLLIATQLSQNQKFEAAQKWFHYIFNPTETEGEGLDDNEFFRRFWKIKPFFEAYDNAHTREQIALLLIDSSDSEWENQIKLWQENPFQPHAIARLRISAYMKTVVMKYLDNLIAWGDHLFRRDTIESINEATQLYILAAEILGQKPILVKGRESEVHTFDELSEAGIGALSNALVEIEKEIHRCRTNGITSNDGQSSNLDTLLYFCIPHNDRLLNYWETVADRLFKIRYCMNIEGVVRQLPLFEPPIEPGLLVKAAAMGVDLSSALDDFHAPLPHYRFQFMLQKAMEFCQDVKSLGASMLAALEKKDAEKLALLRANHELQLFKSVREIKKRSVKEAEETLEGVQKAKEIAQTRYDYYASREFMNTNEKLHQIFMALANQLEITAQLSQSSATTMYQIPDIFIGGAGAMGSPLQFSFVFGGQKQGASLESFSKAMGALASRLNLMGQMFSLMAGYQRRAEEWQLQEDMAEKELEQLDKQIVAAQIRLAIAEKDLDNSDLQIENAEEAREFMEDKFTNHKLYNWMVGQISSIYFQSYQMAYDLAKRAEKAYRHELGLEDTNFIQFGYWDSLKKGLLAGESLHKDLRRMEMSYLDQNKREYELSKHISLPNLDPIQLIKLRATGSCHIQLPEIIFDLDHPGHYMRRIKSISLTIPCVTGPYTNINGRLTLINSRIRKNTDTANGYQYRGINDPSFTHINIPARSVAISQGQNDSGVFELNFRDERYLPFEYAGAISNWKLELSGKWVDENNGHIADWSQFDFDTISDVILHIKYTAREGGGEFQQVVRESLLQQLSVLPHFRMFSLRHEFPDEWHRFLIPENAADGNAFEFELKKDHFPFKDASHTLKVNYLALLAKCTETDDYTAKFSPPLPESSPDDANILNLERIQEYGFLHFADKDTSGANVTLDFEPTNNWKLMMTSPTGNNLQTNEVEELMVILGYVWE
jgi:hypothetical protein